MKGNRHRTLRDQERLTARMVDKSFILSTLAIILSLAAIGLALLR